MRLFVALPLPDAARAALSRWMQRCGEKPALRWTPEEQLHITLHFLGEAAEDRAGRIADGLSAIEARAFEVTLDRVETLGRGGLLAACGGPNAGLEALERQVRSRVAGHGEKAEAGRSFLPHVTLGRARRGMAAPRPGMLPSLPKLEFRAACFRLYRSELRREGAVHSVIREWRLR